jgi:hypothetical protein
VQGEGDIHSATQEFLQVLREACDEVEVYISCAVQLLLSALFMNSCKRIAIGLNCIAIMNCHRTEHRHESLHFCSYMK